MLRNATANSFRAAMLIISEGRVKSEVEVPAIHVTDTTQAVKRANLTER
jgi:hypothetical protein